jgi:hypothetical protein
MANITSDNLWTTDTGGGAVMKTSNWRITKRIPVGEEGNDYPGVEISLNEPDGLNHMGAIQVWSDAAEEVAEFIVSSFNNRKRRLAVARKARGKRR